MHIAAVVVLGFAISGFAQKKPDFSGEWILNRQASTLSPGADAVESAVVTIEHREPTFRYKSELQSASNSIKYEYELPSDGRELTGTQGPPSVSSLRWDGDALVFTGRIQRADREVQISFRYELLDGGRRLRATERLRGTGQDQDNVWIFERR